MWFSNPELHPWVGTDPSQPLLWHLQCTDDITTSLVTDSNPTGTINNSELELAGGLLQLVQLDIIAHNYDTCECTILSKTDNLATLFWEWNGSTTTTKLPAHLLCLFGIHQRFHHYIPWYDDISGLSNPMADDSLCFFHLTDSQFFSRFNSKYPQPQSYKLVTPSSQMDSSVISALRMKTCNTEYLWVDPLPPTPIGPSELNTLLSWASTPFSKPSKTKCQSYKCSTDMFIPANLQPSCWERRYFTHNLNNKWSQKDGYRWWNWSDEEECQFQQYQHKWRLIHITHNINLYPICW